MTKAIVAVIGGKVELEEGKTAQLTPLVLDGDTFQRNRPPGAFSYESEDAGIATVSADGLITGISAGASGQQTRVFVRYAEEDEEDGETREFSDIIDVVVHPQGWRPEPTPPAGDWATASDIAYGKRAVVNGVQVVGTAQAYTEGHTIVIPQAFVRAEAAEEE